MKRISTIIILTTAGLTFYPSTAHSQGAASQKKSPQSKIKTSTVKDDSLVYYTKKEVDQAITTNLAKAMKANANYANAQLGISKDNAPYLIVARTKPGLVEIHELWDDVAIIRSGHGILKTGYQVGGDKRITGAEPQREWRGGTIESPEQRDLAPGDFIIIPAMIAHQYIPGAGDTLTYWTIKVKRASIDGEKNKR